jgi:hypothetical protein
VSGKKKKAPTLTDAKGMGGVNAQDGFDYQVWDALGRLPPWLKNPAFEGIIVEGLEDVEARFFTPYAPSLRVIDRFQAKSGNLPGSGVKDVVRSFLEFEEAHPKLARVQTLVTPQLPGDLKWIERDAGRIRRARPFYDPFPEIMTASDSKFNKDLEKQWGQELGTFYQQSVEISINTVVNLAGARANFGAALGAEFPDLTVAVSKVTSLFDILCQIATTRRGTLLHRNELLKIFADGLGARLFDESVLPLHILSDRGGSRSDVFEIDATSFSGLGSGFPPPQQWREKLMKPLKLTADWAHAQGFRRLELSGSYRISTAFALGWAFRSATGFELDVPTKAGHWGTDNHPNAPSGPVPWQIRPPKNVTGDLLRVVVGVLREPLNEAKQAFAGMIEEEMVVITLPQAIRDAQEAQAFAQAVKSAVTRSAGECGVKAIELYMAVPAAFAVVLGHRWNAMPPTQLHEFLSTSSRYTPTISIEG